MNSRHDLNDPWLILRTSIFHNFHDFQKTWLRDKGSRHLQQMACIPSERTSKTMIVDVENESYHAPGRYIAAIKEVIGPPTGGRPLRQSGGPLLPGGECFTQFQDHNL